MRTSTQRAEIALIRAALKIALLDRDHVCLGCGCDLTGITPHMHEGIVSRADAMGWGQDARKRIYTEYNCILICPSCNLGMDGKSAPARERVIELMHERYGGDMVEWMRSLPFKIAPPAVRAFLLRFGC